MKHPGGKGTWPDNCPVCGCPCVITQNDELPQHRRVVWGWEMFDPNERAYHRLLAILDGLGVTDLHNVAPRGAPDGICDNAECCCPWWSIDGKQVWGYDLAERYRQAVEVVEELFSAVVPDAQERLALRLPYMSTIQCCGEDEL
jgi:hypothetical protein